MDIWEIHEISRRSECFNCSRNLSDAREELRPHDDGWQVEGYDALQWVAFKCPLCGYSTSLDKLEIPRP
jgi:hypothetical protein